MSIRTITAPGVQINEIDRSDYTPAMTGTKCLVMGFGNQGEDYIPMEFTSTAAWLNYFKEPDNEAERYFYHACKEVIDNNGVLYAVKLPYENEARGKYVYHQYDVDKQVSQLKSTYDVISANTQFSDKLDTYFTYANDGLRYIIDQYVNNIKIKNALKTIKLQDTTTELSTVFEAWTLAKRIDTKIEQAGITVEADIYAAETVADINEWIIDVCDRYDDIAASLSSPSLSTLGDYEEILNTLDDFAILAGALTTKDLSEYESVVEMLQDDTQIWKDVSAKTILETIQYLNYTSPDLSAADAAYFIDKFNQTLTLKYITDSVGYEEFYDEAVEKNTPSGPQYNQYSLLTDVDSNIRDYLTIKASFEQPGLIEDTDVDEYRTAEKTPGSNKIIIIDKTRGKYGKIAEDKRKGTQVELAGIIPVITTAANAMQAQSILDLPERFVYDYEPISGVATLKTEDINSNILSAEDIVKKFNTSVLDSALGETALGLDTVSKDAGTFFESLEIKDDGHLDSNTLKKIGVVVYRAFIDPQNGNKINFEAIEAFCGSLDKNAKNPTTGVSEFIDTIVNTQSQYINLFSNCFTATSTASSWKNVDILAIPPTSFPSLGFYKDMCKEDIDLASSIYQGIDKVTEKISDINERQIDIIVDAGVSNIAQYLQNVFGGGKGHYDPTSVDASGWTLTKDADAKVWKTVCQKYNNICQNVRKDCMFIADGLRPLVIKGTQKIIRPSKPTNTLDSNVLPYLKFMTGLNTNYGAGYCNWFEKADDFNGQFFWCPPSIQACGIYIYTDLNANYWDAPAGLNRGVVRTATDCSFSPTPKQAGVIYEKNWNYAINYPEDGIVLEGQKTFQVKPSAFDRVNVRRLFLRLERQAYLVARYYVYEPNNAYTRQRLVDALDPDFKAAKIGGGIYDYKIVCDESNNTSNTIDNNELHVSIALKPTKTAEYIIVSFIALSTGGSFDEVM